MFVVITDFPTTPDSEGVLNSHGQVRRVRVCDCPKVVRRFEGEAEAHAFASTVDHSVVLPVRSH